MIGVDVQSSDLAALVRSLKGMEDGKALRKQLRTDLRAAAKPMVPAIRAAVKALPSDRESKRRDRPGLRASTARATRLQSTMRNNFVGVTVRVDPRKMPAGMHNLPAYLEGAPPFQRWRHKVFGRDDWVTQRAHPYFYSTVQRFTPAAQQAVANAVDSIQRQINS